MVIFFILTVSYIQSAVLGARRWHDGVESLLDFGTVSARAQAVRMGSGGRSII